MCNASSMVKLFGLCTGGNSFLKTEEYFRPLLSMKTMKKQRACLLDFSPIDRYQDRRQIRARKRGNFSDCFLGDYAEAQEKDDTI